MKIMEMDPEEMFETTLDPNRRKLVQVSINNYEETMRIFEIQMGNDADKRKEFLLNTSVDKEEIGD